MFIKTAFILTLLCCQAYAVAAPDVKLIDLINAHNNNGITLDKNTASLIKLVRPSESDPWEITEIKTFATSSTSNRDGDLIDYSAIILYSYKNKLVSYTMQRGMICTWVYLDGVAVLSAYSVLGMHETSTFLEVNSGDQPQ